MATPHLTSIFFFKQKTAYEIRASMLAVCLASLKSRAKVKGRFESSTTDADAPQQNAASSGRANPQIEMPTSSCSADGWLRSGDLAKPPGRQVRTSRAQCL